MSEIQVGQINSTDGSTAITTGAGGTVTLSAALTGTDATLSGGVYLGGLGAANYLDDYEEGTWTPIFSGAYSSNPTPGGSASYSGSYRKIGNVVVATFRLSMDQSGANISVDDRWAIGGLPFTAYSESNGQHAGGVFFYSSMGAGNNAMGEAFIDSGGTGLFLYISHTDGTVNYAQTGGVTVTYMVS